MRLTARNDEARGITSSERKSPYAAEVGLRERDDSALQMSSSRQSADRRRPNVSTDLVSCVMALELVHLCRRRFEHTFADLARIEIEGFPGREHPLKNLDGL